MAGGRPQPVEISEGTGRARLCAHVKLWTLNTATDKELRDRRVEDIVNAPTQQALLSDCFGLCLCRCESLHYKKWTKLIIKIMKIGF